MSAQATSHSETRTPALSSVQLLLRELQTDIERASAELALLRAATGLPPGVLDRINAAALSIARASRRLNYADEFLSGALEAPTVSELVEPLERESTPRQAHTPDFDMRPEPSLLTPRETEVAALVAHGLSNAQIAVQLVISTATARVHVEHIMAKLGVHSRGQIALWAIRQRLVP